MSTVSHGTTRAAGESGGADGLLEERHTAAPRIADDREGRRSHSDTATYR